MSLGGMKFLLLKRSKFLQQITLAAGTQQGSDLEVTAYIKPVEPSDN
jgi:hypothetical protein